MYIRNRSLISLVKSTQYSSLSNMITRATEHLLNTIPDRASLSIRILCMEKYFYHTRVLNLQFPETKMGDCPSSKAAICYCR